MTRQQAAGRRRSQTAGDEPPSLTPRPGRAGDAVAAGEGAAALSIITDYIIPRGFVNVPALKHQRHGMNDAYGEGKAKRKDTLERVLSLGGRRISFLLKSMFYGLSLYVKR